MLEVPAVADAIAIFLGAQLEPAITSKPPEFFFRGATHESDIMKELEPPIMMRTSLNPNYIIYPSDPVFSTKGMLLIYANLTNLRIPITQTGTALDASRLLGLLDTLLSSLPVLDTLQMIIGGNLSSGYNTNIQFPDKWMCKMLLSEHDRPAYWSNRVRTLVLDRGKGPRVKTISTQLFVVILARMFSLRVLEVRLPVLAAVRVLGVSPGAVASYVSAIPDWPLERLATGAIPSGVMCALLSGARTSSLRVLDHYEAKDDTDVITSALQLNRLQTIIFRKDLQQAALKGWLPVIIMPTIKRLRIRREQFNLMAYLLPRPMRCEQSPFIPPNVVHLELECSQILGDADGEIYRSTIEGWIDQFASVLDEHARRRGRVRLRSVTLLVRYNEYTRRSPAENVDFGSLMDACAARRIRVDCVNIDTGITMGIQRCARVDS